LSKARAVRIAVDAMGGDHAPREVVRGAVEGARREGVVLFLVGDPEAIRRELEALGDPGVPVEVVPAEGVIQEGEPPAQALRQKPRASIPLCAHLVKEGRADAMVTMGSTGAVLAATVLLWGTLEGIDRPALGGPILGTAPRTLLIDLGTQVDCRPGQLVDFAVLGWAFARHFLEVQEPRIALLNVGAEPGKGNRQVREAYELLQASGLPFVGNLEGYDLPFGRAEVVVCDGFVGNVVMKLVEGLGSALAERLRAHLSEHLPPERAEALAQEVWDLTNLAERTGGGPIFGVRGIAIVGHGRSRAPAVARAIGTAREAVERRLVAVLESALAQYRARTGRQAGG